MKALNRRGLLRLLPMAPAAAKAMASEIASEAARAVAITDSGGAPPIGHAVGPGNHDTWSKIHNFTRKQLRQGTIPEHRKVELRRSAFFRARMREDDNIESLLSISNGHRRRMHIESAYRANLREEIEMAKSEGAWIEIWKRFGGVEEE